MAEYSLNPYVPFARQQKLHECPCFEVLFGGQVGGGKSIAALAELVRWVHHPQYMGLMLRPERTQFRHIIRKSYEMYMGVDPKARFDKQAFVWTFSSGAQIQFGYMSCDEHYWQYHGNEYQRVVFEELTLFKPGPKATLPWGYFQLMGRCRAPGGFMDCQMISTTNPGGVGHLAVKKYFIDPAPPETPVRYKVKLRDGRIISRYKIFIPSALEDNPALFDDGQYEASLEPMRKTSPAQYQALRHGRWDVAFGAVFTYLDPDVHYISPSKFKLYADAPRLMTVDWGFHRGVALWLTKDNDDNILVYRELVFGNWTPAMFAAEVKRIETKSGETSVVRVADPACKGHQAGPSILEQLWQEGCGCFPGNNDRYQGLQELHNRFQRVSKFKEKDGTETHVPALQISTDCTYLCETLTTLAGKQTSYRGIQFLDVDTDGDDHGYDALRYGCMAWPLKGSLKPRKVDMVHEQDPRERMWRDMDDVTGYG